LQFRLVIDEEDPSLRISHHGVIAPNIVGSAVPLEGAAAQRHYSAPIDLSIDNFSEA